MSKKFQLRDGHLFMYYIAYAKLRCPAWGYNFFSWGGAGGYWVESFVADFTCQGFGRLWDVSRVGGVG